VALSPAVALLRPWLGDEIDYRADIGPGMLILHPNLGVVVNGESLIGARLTLVGGNCIGGRGVRAGDNLTLGANATVIGPISLGDGVLVAAGGVAVRDFAGPGELRGVPARPTLGQEC